LVEAIQSGCRILEIPLGLHERTQLSELNAAGLESLLARIEAERRWP
jgi:hypothetical protein